MIFSKNLLNLNSSACLLNSFLLFLGCILPNSTGWICHDSYFFRMLIFPSAVSRHSTTLQSRCFSALDYCTISGASPISTTFHPSRLLYNLGRFAPLDNFFEPGSWRLYNLSASRLMTILYSSRSRLSTISKTLDVLNLRFLHISAHCI